MNIIYILYFFPGQPCARLTIRKSSACTQLGPSLTLHAWREPTSTAKLDTPKQRRAAAKAGAQPSAEASLTAALGFAMWPRVTAPGPIGPWSVAALTEHGEGAVPTVPLAGLAAAESGGSHLSYGAQATA